MVEVLLIISEDSDSDIALFKKYFRSKEVSITIIPSFESAINKLNSGLKPKAILADISLPDMSPYSFLEILKNDENLCDIPVYYLTSQDSKTTNKENQKYIDYGDMVDFFKFYI